MGWWLADEADGALVERSWVKRFDPRFWTVNFPRPAMAAVTTIAPDALRVDLSFYRAADLVGLIWESADRFDHPLLRYATSRDYRGCRLRFRWRSVGDVLPLDAVNGPTLTVEGRDAGGTARSWYVRLWNHAEGDPHDAWVTLDFDALREGFEPGGAILFAGDVDRMFISLVPPGHGGAGPLPERARGTVFVEDIACEGGGSTLAIGDALVPPHELRVATGYDDAYNLTPERLLRNAMHLGYRAWINHYVGMSHWFELAWTGARFEVVAGLNDPCRRWHEDFAARARALGYRLILSLSYELFDAHAPEAWKQRDAEGRPALTGWEPPSTLLSPANAEAMAYLRATALAFCGIAAEAGLDVHFQIGEPWWWTGFGDDRPACFYDGAATALYAAETGLAVPAALTDARQAPSAAQRAYLDWLGTVLGRSTLELRDAVTAAHPGARVYLLFYAPQVIEAGAEHLTAVNMPAAWRWPAFDVLQLEDYDFVIAGDESGARRAADAVTRELGYAPARQHYFAGFVLRADDARLWQPIAAAAEEGGRRGVAETFVWALPQVLRDGFTWFDTTEGAVEAFHDVRFPVAVGLGAGVAPTFATDVFAAASGFEQRNARWADARLSFDAGLGVRSEAELAEVVAFFRARRGRAAGFRFRDPTDWSSNGATEIPSAGDVRLGIGNGVQTRFELVKRYGEGAEAQVRRITRPEAGSVRVAVNGVERADGWSLTAAGGIVDFDAPPPPGAEVTAGFRFDVPVRFAEDRLELSLTAFRAGEVPSIPLIEVREG